MLTNNISTNAEYGPPIETLRGNASAESSTRSWEAFKRVLCSELFKSTLALAGTLISFTAIAISIPSLIATVGMPTAAIFTSAYVTVQISVVLFFAYKMCKNAGEDYKKLRYEVSLLPTIVCNSLNSSKWPWSHPIIDNSLTLGAIPLKNRGHVTEISEKGVTHILTMLEPFELTAKSVFSEPVTAEDWTRSSIGRTFIETADFEPVSFENIEASVAEIRRVIEGNGHIYVHCKAGRGRSATVVICYLLKFGAIHGLSFENADQAIAYVKARRPVININEAQKAAIYNYAERLH